MNSAESPRALRVFVVENHADTLKWLVRYLQLEGHEVAAVTTMHEALAALPAAAPDVLLSDIGLPDGDGWELLQTLRADSRTLPPFAIAMSGFGLNADQARSKAAGYRHHMLKPFDPAELTGYLEEARAELAAHA